MRRPCLLCRETPARYVKTKGGFHKLCWSCEVLLHTNGLTAEPEIIHAQGSRISETPSTDEGGGEK